MYCVRHGKEVEDESLSEMFVPGSLRQKPAFDLGALVEMAYWVVPGLEGLPPIPTGG